MTRILLIDDDDLVRTMLRQVLSHAGHTVIEARDGREGLLKFTDAKADLVITDIIMPDTEGTEVIMELRRLEPDLKIIAMSGGGRANAVDYLRIAKYLGATTVLRKPFMTEVLLNAVNELFPGRDPRPLASDPS